MKRGKIHKRRKKLNVLLKSSSFGFFHVNNVKCGMNRINDCWRTEKKILAQIKKKYEDDTHRQRRNLFLGQKNCLIPKISLGK